MPRATWRIMPARTMSLWLTTSASAGSSFKVGMSVRGNARCADLSCWGGVGSRERSFGS